MKKVPKAASMEIASLFLWLWWLCLPFTCSAQYSPLNKDNFNFTKSLYNVSIAENSIANTYVTSFEKMGIPILTANPEYLQIEYRIEGDGNNIFKAEEHFEGDFCFLRIRTSTVSFRGVINREARSSYSLRVVAIASYSFGNQLQTSVDLIVNVLDENDLSPLFDKNFYSVQIPEDAPLHSSIAQVSASDADIGINGEVYFRLAKRTNKFAIHPTSGVVTLTHKLKYSFQTIYEVNILASDRGPKFPNGPKPTVKTLLKITVTAVNYQPPTIKVHNHPSIVEHGHLGSIYAILMVSDSDNGKNGHINSVDIVDGDPENQFRIVQGKEMNLYNIEILSSLDRESSPYGYNLTIQATDKGNPPRSSTTNLHVQIQDTNDNEPKFKQDSYQTSISEVVPINTPVIIVNALDNDWGKNSEIIYSIVSGNTDSLFKIEEYSGLITTSAQLDADVIAGVDRSNPTIFLTIHAEDQANSGTRKFSETKVKIAILDYNDNSPTFNQKSFTGEIDENEPEGISVLRVVAHDIDAGDNGTIIYSIPDAQSVPFDIDQFSGVITTKTRLDFEKMQSQYNIRVRASDMGLPYRREVETTVIVKLRNVNDNHPEFEVVDCSGTISRDAKEGTLITVVTAIDMDIGDVISYRIIGGNEHNCFRIEPSSGAITLRCDLRSYPNDSLSLMVAATDDKHISKPTTINMTLIRNKSLPGTSQDVRITCSETDVRMRLAENYKFQTAFTNNKLNEVSTTSGTPAANNHAPVFKPNTPDYIEVPEDLTIGSQIKLFQADDQDIGYNGRLVYGIADGNKKGAFVIDTFTGALKLMSSLDRETTVTYTLMISVSDLGSPHKNSSTNLRIVVTDVNDNRPAFEKDTYEVNISEDQHVNTTVISIMAKDVDQLGHNAKVHYSILTDTDDFNIDTSGGIIRVNRPLDREIQNSYKLIVQAKDSGLDVQLASQTIVTINLVDVNDNRPKFIPPSYFVKVREDLPVGALVTILTAEDLDSGKNGELTYSLTLGADDKFEIDAKTGVIRIAGTLDYEEKQSYNISALAEDRGIPPLASACLVNIEIVDVNENFSPPLFDSFIAKGYVDENEKVGTFVMNVVAKDPDSLPNEDNAIIYSIRDGSGLGRFTIDNNGTIRTTQVLDRESASHYWLAVYAQDRSLVPRSSRLEVLITVLDVNDNVPHSLQPGYYTSVSERESNQDIVTIQAMDDDQNPNQQLHFEITGGNPQSFFKINPQSGLISTTNRELDRESQDEHALEITISDNGRPNLQSTTRVIVKVTDVNDNKPKFITFFKDAYVRILETSNSNSRPIYRVVAFDKDDGPNSFITYSIVKPNNSPFSVDSSTGNIYAISSLDLRRDYVLQVRATDHGSPPRKSQTKIRLSVVKRPRSSKHAPYFIAKNYSAIITENDVVGEYIIKDVTATDDNDDIWYFIDGGNENHTFAILPSTGSLLLARKVDREIQASYELGVCATDGIHTNCTWVHIKVIDINDNEPVFSQDTYIAEISENANIGQSVIQLSATDADEDNRVFFTIRSSVKLVSQKLFEIDERQGIIKVAQPLDREVLSRHVLTVMVNDLGTPSKRSFARVKITVLDDNDHNPVFLSPVFSGRVYETSAVGTSVVQLIATDRDKGDNAELTYSLVAGNAGSTFGLDSKLGLITVVKELDRHNQDGYTLEVAATDHGTPPRSSTAMVKIDVTISDNSPPKFSKLEYMAEMKENLPVGTIVLALQASSQSSLVYQILPCLAEDFFLVNPNSGVISTRQEIDFEEHKYFNFTVKATNIVDASSEVTVVIHITDTNDNHPVFLHEIYNGHILESDPTSSFVLDENNSPLVIQAKDEDYDANALLHYKIIDLKAREYFLIDPNTGTLRTKTTLDHETISSFNFSIQVYDGGKPSLNALKPATVIINVIDVNDSPPRFPTHTHKAKVLLPTYKDITVIELNASDPDGNKKEALIYSIMGGNEGNKFTIDSKTGVITIRDESNMKPSYYLRVMVTDGKFQTSADISITVEKTIDFGLRFTENQYIVYVEENLKKVDRLLVVQPVGHSINEHLTFKLLNNKNMFSVGQTSGVLYTKGVPFDRELNNNYTVVVSVEDSREPPRYAHVVISVIVNDLNDNVPMFINQPYYSAVSVESKAGDVIKQVTAIDKDFGENGRITYSLIPTSHDKFDINQYTGEIVVKHLTIDDENSVVMLDVEAKDHGDPFYSARAQVPINIVSSYSPMFDKQFYNVTVPENVVLYTPVTSIHAVSPTNQKLIYSISDGNQDEDFAVDFNTGLISVMGELDYENKKQDTLTLRATDVTSGNYAETRVHLHIKDINDNEPIFTSMTYTEAVSEALAVGSTILKLTATDADAGMNQLISYSLAPYQVDNNDMEYFHVNFETGDLFLQKKLDCETQTSYRFLAVATDSGMPALSSTALVHLMVIDTNDNAPQFFQSSFDCSITDQAQRGQLVTRLLATDADSSDVNNLSYTIIGGNEKQTFTIDSASGLVSISGQRKPVFQPVHSLNISVTDGVYTSYTRLTISVHNSNRHTPQFSQTKYQSEFYENQAPGSLVGSVSADDEDRGGYGLLTYYITSDAMKEFFQIDADTGEVLSMKVLDREEQERYTIPIAATDNGGKMNFTTLYVTIKDQNDNLPSFKIKEYKGNVDYNAAVGTEILKIEGDDLDNGDNGKIMYSIYQEEDPDVNTIFAINSNTGSLAVNSSLADKENAVYQFFVRAKDSGDIPLENHVPVEILIMGPDENPPSFDQESYAYLISENAEVGATIATIKANGEGPLVYSIVSGVTEATNSPPKFSINDSGQVKIIEALDRETVDTFMLTIRASTQTSPALVANAKVVIRLKDVNDNAPVFESDPYIITLVENTSPGTSLIQVKADDKDEESFLEYKLGADMEEVANIFNLDPETGWITLLTSVDREEREEFNITVVVYDKNLGITQSATSSVSVTITDFNDNPPEFNRNHYTTSVNEDADLDIIFLSVTATDVDIGQNSEISYYITHGDKQGHFDINRNGDLFVSKRSLDRESKKHYRLTIAATDGAFVSYASVDIDILDANDNSPQCTKLMYTIFKKEDIPVGTRLGFIEATDQDDPATRNSRLEYKLSGIGAESFHLDRITGILTTALELDRETQSKYNLIAAAIDGGGLSCTSEVNIYISDINDNAPVFTLTENTFSIQEDARINTLVTRVTATDKDLGINKKIVYGIMGDSRSIFSIDSNSGIISLISPLDREITSQHIITVTAKNLGPTPLFNSTELRILVLDVNDNEPEFERTSYYVEVPEDTQLDATILTVKASSLDIGQNANITYSIMAGNEQSKFKIDPNNGAIIVQEPLDFELSREYFLTILAKDHGEPPLSNSAIVNINITDINDNKPRFSQSAYYTVSVKEDLKLHEEIIKVLATDDDGENNNKLTYLIQSGDVYGQFHINQDNGSLTLVKSLDREMMDTYVLQIDVRDSGQPVLSNSAVVNIKILDANDNPPLFSEQNYTTYIQEGSKAGINILKLSATDDDLEENGGPFTFDIVKGNENKEFHINKDGVILTSGGDLKKKVKESYQLTVRAFDKGSPVLFSDVVVDINVVDESMYPPQVRNLTIAISSYLGKTMKGVIGKVNAFDADPYDILNYRIVSANDHLFDVHPSDGRIIAISGLDAGSYKVNVSVSDGRFNSYSIVTVEVMEISEEMMDSSVTIQFKEMFPEQFYANYLKDFQKILKRELNVRAKDVEILNVQPADESIMNRSRRRRSLSNNLDVLFVVRKVTGKLFNKNSLRRKVERARDAIETGLNVEVEKVFNDICTKSMCDSGPCVSHLVFDDTDLEPVTVGADSYVSARHRYVYFCNCSDGSCNGVVCGDKRCSANQICHRNNNRYSCRCPSGKTGSKCQDNVYSPSTICRPDDTTCKRGNQPMTFNGKSFARWTLTETTEKRLTLSLRFRTRKPNCNVMYTTGQVDYSILEIKDSSIQYRFNCGSGEGFVKIPVDVSDGQWHLIMLERNGRTAELFLDQGYKAISSAPGTNDELNLDSFDIYFGAEVEVFPEGYNDIKRGFEGCMEGIRMFNILLPFTGTNRIAVSQKFEDVEFKCKDYATLPTTGNICGRHPCMNGGTCQYRQINSYFCQCMPRFQGIRCEIDNDPCQDNPCFNQGICKKDKDVINGYTCICSGELKGKQCKYGKYCHPDTCKNGGVCIEGPNSPLCHCLPKYQGLYCDKMVDPCVINPCYGGGTCRSNNDNYQCICTKDKVGRHCEDYISVAASIKIPVMLIYIIIGIVVGVIAIVILIIVICCVCKRRRKNRRRPHDAHNTNELNRMLPEDKKRSNKKLNEEISLPNYPRNPPPVPDRPVSYTPSNHDSMNTLNNFDNVRNYGSAGDELERSGVHNIPTSFCPADVYTHRFGTPPAAKHYYSTFQSPPSNPQSDTDSIQKDPQEYEYPTNFLENYSVEKKAVDKMTMKCLPGMSPKVLRNALAQHDASSVSSLPVSESEDDLNAKRWRKRGYHWDTSDWAPKPHLPNICELPSAEVPDSPCSSNHSNDSNTHVDNGQESDMNGNESEYVGDSEFADDYDDNEQPPPEYDEYPNYQRILNLPEVEDYHLPVSIQQMRSDLYLPGYDMNSSLNDQDVSNDADGDLEDSNHFYNDGDNNSVIKVQIRQPWQEQYLSQLSEYNTDNELSSFRDDTSVSMGGNISQNNSLSDISGLCDFEDSEINASESEDDASSRLLQNNLHSRV